MTLANNERFNHYKIGHKEIDDDHMYMFDLMSLASTSSSRDELLMTAKLLQTFWVEHIEREHKFMEDVKFPYIKYHIEEHNKISEAFKKSFSSIIDNTINEANITNRYNNPMNHLIETLLNHIDHYDTQFGDYIQKLNDNKDQH